MRIESVNKRLEDCDDRIKKQKRKNRGLGRQIKYRKYSRDRFRRQEADIRVEVEEHAEDVDVAPECAKTADIYRSFLDQLFTIQDMAAANLQKLADLHQEAIAHGLAIDNLAEERSRLKAELRALQKEMSEKHATDTS